LKENLDNGLDLLHPVLKHGSRSAPSKREKEWKKLKKSLEMKVNEERKEGVKTS